MPTKILLTTLNARYMHTAFALRYLYANLHELKSCAKICEFTIQERAIDIAEKLLKHNPLIIGFSIYIWNVEETTEVIALLKQIAPRVKIIVGGPEVSFANDQPALVELVDHIITGPGESSFYRLCADLINQRPVLNRLIEGEALPLNQLILPYQYYSEDDIRNRLIYVEASRGCPFKCEFCLSALDKTAKPFELNQFLEEMAALHERGARNFKFIDRTFNLKVSSSVAILEFFLDRMSDDLYLHFEVIPDQLPDLLKQTLVKFPPHSLQFEIGVQTFDPDIQNLISRRQDNDKTCENLRWLRGNTGAHIHADLIFGLPGDSLENFANSFNQLVELKPQEIQLGILKRLRGAPINRHSDDYQMRYNPKSPYNILSTRDIDFQSMQRVNRFARFWDLIGNSGRFKHTLPLILDEDPFSRFLQFSDALYRLAGRSWKISLRQQFELIFIVLEEHMEVGADIIKHALNLDYQYSGQKGLLEFDKTKFENGARTGIANKRQKKHAD
ncbi:MAG: B12-binding domain-containing radical SAM protein [Gammaproteobacteria bacterium]|nr:B12-binding domain-containing radical SAM protein [Gammaproteobacteria bacterium]